MRAVDESGKGDISCVVVPSSTVCSAVRLHVTGMQSCIAFSPFLTWRPSSFHLWKVAIGPGAIPRACIGTSRGVDFQAVAVKARSTPRAVARFSHGAFE